ncbi:MAG: OmpA family protein [Deltaproteobacteria bacterium]|nr:OmpA family protein [Deltaproteobacteria bacterium]
MKKSQLLALAGFMLFFSSFFFSSCVSKAEYERVAEEARIFKEQRNYLASADKTHMQTQLRPVVVPPANATPIKPAAPPSVIAEPVVAPKAEEVHATATDAKDNIVQKEEKKVAVSAPATAVVVPPPVIAPSLPIVVPVPPKETKSRAPEKIVEKPAPAPSGAYPALKSSIRSLTTSRKAYIHEKGAIFAITIPGKLLFAAGSADLQGAGEQVLREISRHLKGINAVRFRIIGHAGAADLNVTGVAEKFGSSSGLSTARAEVVMSQIAKNGVSQRSLATVGYSTDTRRLYGANTGNEPQRRIVIQILKEE